MRRDIARASAAWPRGFGGRALNRNLDPATAFSAADAARCAFPDRGTPWEAVLPRRMFNFFLGSELCPGMGDARFASVTGLDRLEDQGRDQGQDDAGAGGAAPTPQRQQRRLVLRCAAGEAGRFAFGLRGDPRRRDPKKPGQWEKPKNWFVGDRADPRFAARYARYTRAHAAAGGAAVPPGAVYARAFCGAREEVVAILPTGDAAAAAPQNAGGAAAAGGGAAAAQETQTLPSGRNVTAAKHPRAVVMVMIDNLSRVRAMRDLPLTMAALAGTDAANPAPSAKESGAESGAAAAEAEAFQFFRAGVLGHNTLYNYAPMLAGGDPNGPSGVSFFTPAGSAARRDCCGTTLFLDRAALRCAQPTGPGPHSR